MASVYSHATAEKISRENFRRKMFNKLFNEILVLSKLCEFLFGNNFALRNRFSFQLSEEANKVCYRQREKLLNCHNKISTVTDEIFTDDIQVNLIPFELMISIIDVFYLLELHVGSIIVIESELVQWQK